MPSTTHACVSQAWRLHEMELRAFLLSRTTAAEAEDLLQHVFLKAIQQGKRLCGMDSVRGWLFKVARNALIDHYRANENHGALAQPLSEPFAENIAASEQEDAPVEALSECLPRVLSELNPEDREVITRCDLEGMPQAEFAQIHNLGLPATKSRLQRARKRLKATLKANCQVKFDDTGNVCCFVPRP